MADISQIRLGTDVYNVKDTTARTDIATLEAWKTALFSTIYPVGAVYLTFSSSFNPATVFGGTWEKVAAGKTLVGVDANDTNFDTAGDVYGYADTPVVTHTHPSASHSHTVNNHTHGPGNLSGYIRGREKDNDNSGYASFIRYTFSGGFNANSYGGQTAIINAGATGGASPGTDIATVSVEAPVDAVAGTKRNYQPSMAVYIWKRTA